LITTSFDFFEDGGILRNALPDADVSKTCTEYIESLLAYINIGTGNMEKMLK
jgi:hypothetical protein